MTKVWVDRVVKYGTFPTDMQGASSWWLMQTVSRFGLFRTEASTYVEFSFSVSGACNVRIGVAYDYADTGPSKATQFTGAGWTLVETTGHPQTLITPSGMNPLKIAWYEKAVSGASYPLKVTLPMPDMYDEMNQKLHGVMYVVAVPGSITITNTRHAPMPWTYSGNTPSGSVDYASSDLLGWFWGETYKTRPSYADYTTRGSVWQTPADQGTWETWFANGGTPYASLGAALTAIASDGLIGEIPRIYFIADGTYANVGSTTLSFATGHAPTSQAPLYIFAQTANGVVFNGNFKLALDDLSWIWIDAFKHTGTNGLSPFYNTTSSCRGIVLNRINFPTAVGNVGMTSCAGKWNRVCYTTIVDSDINAKPFINSRGGNEGFNIYDHIYIDGSAFLATSSTEKIEATIFENNNAAGNINFALDCYHDILYTNAYLNQEDGSISSLEFEAYSQKSGGVATWNWTTTNNVGYINNRRGVMQCWYEGICARDNGDSAWGQAGGGRSGGVRLGAQSVLFDSVFQGLNSLGSAKSAYSAIVLNEGRTGSGYDTTFDITLGDYGPTRKTLIADVVIYGCNVSISGNTSNTYHPQNVRFVNVLAKGVGTSVFNEAYSGNITSASTFIACQGNGSSLGITTPSGWTNIDPGIVADANGWYQAGAESPERSDIYIKGVPYYKDRAPASHNLMTTSTTGYNVANPVLEVDDVEGPVLTGALAATGGANQVVLTLTPTDVSGPITVDWYRMERVLLNEAFDETTPYNIDNFASDPYYNDTGVIAALTYQPTQDPYYDGVNDTYREYGRMSIGIWGDSGAYYEWEPSASGFKITTVSGAGTAKRYLFANCLLADNDLVMVTPTFTWDGVHGSLWLLLSNNALIPLTPADSGVPVVATVINTTGKPSVHVVATGDFDGHITGLSVYKASATVDQTSDTTGQEQTATDTGLGDAVTYYYLAKATDNKGNVTWSAIASDATDAAAPTKMEIPFVTPTSGVANTSLTITVTEDGTDCATYYTTNGDTPDSGDTLVVGGTFDLEAPLSGITLKLRSFEDGAGGRDPSEIASYGPYTVNEVPLVGPTCSNFSIDLVTGTSNNIIDYLTLGSCSDPGGYPFYLKKIDSTEIVQSPQTVFVASGNGLVYVFDDVIYHNPITTGYEGDGSFTYTLSNGSVDSSPATATVTYSVPTDVISYDSTSLDYSYQYESGDKTISVVEDFNVSSIFNSLTWNIVSTGDFSPTVNSAGVVSFNIPDTANTFTGVFTVTATSAVDTEVSQDFTLNITSTESYTQPAAIGSIGVRVGSFNVNEYDIGYGRNYLIAYLLGDYNLNVLCLQEVPSTQLDGYTISGLMEELTTMLGMDGYILGSTVNGDHGGEKNNAILYSGSCSSNGDVIYADNYSTESCGFCWATITSVNGRPVTYVSTQLSSDSATRLLQLAELEAYFSNYTGPVVIGGDLGFVNPSSDYTLADSYWDDCYTLQTPTGASTSTYSTTPDFIWLRDPSTGQLGCTAIHIVDDLTHSDHRPVYADVYYTTSADLGQRGNPVWLNRILKKELF